MKRALIVLAALALMVGLGAASFGPSAADAASAARTTAVPAAPSGAERRDWSSECTEFGDRLYWPTGSERTSFAVVPGGCRT